MTQALPGVWYAKRRKLHCTIHIQDLWPDNIEIVAGIKNKYISNIISRMCSYIYKRCDMILTTSESFKATLMDRGVSDSKLNCWYQYAEDFYKYCYKKRYESDGIFRIIFTGNIGYAQGLDILPRTAELLKGRKIKFIIVGDGRYREKLEDQLRDAGITDMFEFAGRVSPESVPSYLSKCDAAFISFMPNELFMKTIPAKLQSYMACGMPIIASAGGETERIIREADCGICVKVGDAESLAVAINEMMSIPEERLYAYSNNAVDYYQKHFDKEKLMDELERYIV